MTNQEVFCEKINNYIIKANIMPHVEVRLKIPVTEQNNLLTCLKRLHDNLIECYETNIDNLDKCVKKARKGKISVALFKEEPDYFYVCFEVWFATKREIHKWG